MKILNLSVYADGTGYSQSSIGHLMSMDSVGIDLVCRKVRLSGFDGGCPDRLLELEKKDLNGVTHVLQHYLPQMFKWQPDVKNIGLFHYETTHFKPSSWQYYCNLMDNIVVNSTQNRDACVNSRVKTPIEYIPQPINTKRFQKQAEPLNLPVGGKYVFYAVGDFSYRKNYQALIRAFLTTFSRRDDVVLILKSYLSSTSAEESQKQIVDYINMIKQRLRKHHTAMYPEIIVLSQRLNDDQMLALHQMSDCFVSVEMGAGICLPALDAYAVGNDIIAPAWGGHTDFLTDYDKTRFIEGNLEPCFGVDQNSCPYPNLYTSYEEWFNCDQLDLCMALQEKYNKGKKPSGLGYNAKAERYSYENVGKLWIKSLSKL